MRLFLKRLLWFVLPLLVIFAGCSLVSKLVLRCGDFYRLKPDAENIILGHSQTECDLNDSLIARTQNFSQGGEAYFYTYQKLKKLAADNPQIKTVFISYANNQINERMDKWIWGNENMYNYYPKYSFMMDWSDYQTLLRHNPQEVLKSETKSIKDFAMFLIKNHKDFLRGRNWGGYLYLKRDKVDSLLKTDYLKKERNAIKLKRSETNIGYLEKIVRFCKEKHIRIIFIRTPIRPDMPFLKNEAQYKEVKKARFNDVPMLDFRDFPATTDEFGDFDHLNHKGARRFSVFFNTLLADGILQSATMQADIDKAIQTLNLNDSIR